jgi:hypothetical protein
VRITFVLPEKQNRPYRTGHSDTALGLAADDPEIAIDVVAMALPLAKDSPRLPRRYTVAARAYAPRGGHAEATAAIWRTMSDRASRGWSRIGGLLRPVFGDPRFDIR